MTLSIFFLPKKTQLFRANTLLNIVPKDRPTYYALDPRDAWEYYLTFSSTYIFRVVETTRNLRLLDMRFANNFIQLLDYYKSKNDKMVEAIRIAFFYNKRQSNQNLKSTERCSLYDNDRFIVDTLCRDRSLLQTLTTHRQKIDGFFFPKYTTHACNTGHFHAEVVLCFPYDSVEVLPIYTQQQVKMQKSLTREIQKSFVPISTQTQNKITSSRSVVLTLSQFSQYIPNAIEWHTTVVSRTSAFSYVLKTIFLILPTPDVWFTTPLLSKCNKFNYEKNILSGQQKYSKIFQDSFVLEYINGCWINEHAGRYLPFFVLTYTLLYAPRTQATRNFLTQIQTNQTLDYTYFPFLTKLENAMDTPTGSCTKYLEDPVKACSVYEQSMFSVVIQQCIDKNMTLGRFLNSALLKKNKLIELMKISLTLCGVLVFLGKKFSHNDLHVNNILLSLDDPVYMTIQQQLTFGMPAKPIIIDYGRASTPFSSQFLKTAVKTSSCVRTRTTLWKNTYNSTYDLIFLHQVRAYHKDMIDTYSRDGQIQEVKNAFFSFLDELPHPEYFEEQNVLVRASYTEWCQTHGIQMKSISTIERAYEALKQIVLHFHSVFALQTHEIRLDTVPVLLP